MRESLIGASTDALNRQLGQFLQTNPEPAPSADVGGCVKKAAELLAGFDGDRYLLAATSARSGRAARRRAEAGSRAPSSGLSAVRCVLPSATRSSTSGPK